MLHFSLGYIYTLGNMLPYMYSYVKVRVDPNVQEKYFQWFSAAALGIQGITMPIGGFLSRKFGYRPIVIGGCGLVSSAVMLTFLTIKHSFLATLTTYALLFGSGIGFCYAVILATAHSWFPARRGLVVGFVVSGFGLGSFFFMPIQTRLINPNNVKVDKVERIFVDKELLDRVPRTFIILGSVLLCIQIVGNILLRSKPKEEGSPTTEPSQPLVRPASESATPEVNFAPKDLPKQIDFYLLWFVMFCNIIPVSLYTSTYKLFGQRYIANDAFLSGAATVASLFNIIGRIMWGFLVDKLSFKIPLCTMFVIWTSMLVTFPHLVLLPAPALKALYPIWLCILYLCLSGVFAIMPAATSQLFGPANMAVNYGLVFNAFFFGSLTSALVTYLVPVKDAYVALYSFCAIICVIELTLVFLYHM